MSRDSVYPVCRIFLFPPEFVMWAKRAISSVQTKGHVLPVKQECSQVIALFVKARDLMTVFNQASITDNNA